MALSDACLQFDNRQERKQFLVWKNIPHASKSEFYFHLSNRRQKRKPL